MQRRLMYFPTGGMPTPGEIGLTDVEPVTFETNDGFRLSSWFVPASGASSRVTGLVFGGNTGNRSHRGPLAAAFHRHGLQVLLVDYRGYGGNPGAPTENGLAADSHAARAYLASRPDVDALRIVYFGESLGTAVALDLAVEHPPSSRSLSSADPPARATDAEVQIPGSRATILVGARDRSESLSRESALAPSCSPPCTENALVPRLG